VPMYITVTSKTSSSKGMLIIDSLPNIACDIFLS